MTLVSYIYLAVQAFVVFTAALYFRKKIPLMLWLITVSVYITMPLGILITGIASAFYLIDLMLPVMIIFSLAHNGRGMARMLKNNLFLILGVLLFVVPMATGSILLLLGYDIFVYDGLKNHLVWFYRNTVLMFTFGVAIASRLNKDQLKAFIEMNIVLGLCLSLAGILNYIGPFNLAHDSIGTGFMGLFRGSVGQWFAILGIIAVGSYNYVPKGIKILSFLLIISSIAVILLSFSRAGIIGIATGMSAMVFFTKEHRFAMVAVVAISSIFIISVITDQSIKKRYSINEITGHIEEDSAIQDRLEGWDQSLHLLWEDPVVLLLGVAPANAELVNEKIGLWGAHNEFLTAIIDCGVIELFMLMAVLILLLRGAIKKWLSNEDIELKNIYIILFSVICANIVISLTQNHLLQSYGTYTCISFIYLFYGVFIGAEPNNGEIL